MNRISPSGLSVQKIPSRVEKWYLQDKLDQNPGALIPSPGSAECQLAVGAEQVWGFSHLPSTEGGT